MTPGDLIASMARALKLKESTVSAHYRKLREAGLVSRKGRGRGSPESTVTDAAALLISILVADTAVAAAESFRQFAGLHSPVLSEANLKAFSGVPLIEAVVTLLVTRQLTEGGQEVRLVAANRQQTAQILLDGYQIDFEVPAQHDESLSADRAVYESFGPLLGGDGGISGGLQTFSSVTTAELRALSDALV